jgi:hypothetical protein
VVPQCEVRPKAEAITKKKKKSLSKMEYKIVKRKSLKTQSLNTPLLSHKRDSSPKERTKGQTSLLLGQTAALFHSFSLSLSHISFFLFSLSPPIGSLFFFVQCVGEETKRLLCSAMFFLKIQN